MDLSPNMIFIILCAILITTKAEPTSEEEEETNGEYGEYVEGDMLLTQEQQDELYNTDIDNRNGLLATSSRWPNAEVLYYIVEKNFDLRGLKILYAAMVAIEKRTCVRFRFRRNKNDHAVRIQSTEPGCFSSVGRNPPGSQQVLNLGKNCLNLGTVIHEMLHTLGFRHMQSTYNRDYYVTILYKNIERGREHNFNKYNIKEVTNFNVKYDYGSIMHYSGKAFSRNGQPTIVPKQKNVTIGQRKGLSEKDILKINRMYCNSQ